jgi:ubiquinone/menaquinone biosynthesis C-methylase UbiE
MRIDAARVVQENLANYSSAWSAEEYTRSEGLRGIERELVAEFMPAPPATVLDIGCGAGRTTIGLAQAGFAPVAIDLSPQLLGLARRRHPGLDFREMDAANLTFHDRTFDAALFSYNGIDNIYPVAARRRCLEEVFRVLKPGGVFIFSSHNAVGALFSGGFFYVRGYLNAMRMLALQKANPLRREWYWRYHDPGGPQLLYSAPPRVTVAQLEHAGFVVRDVRGSTGERRPGRVSRSEQHVYFVASRPRPEPAHVPAHSGGAHHS